MKSQIRTMVIGGACGALACAASAMANPVFSDQFASSTLSSSWSAYNPSSVGTAPTTTTDTSLNALSGDTYVMRLSSTAENDAVIATFPQVTLTAPGQYIQLSFDMRFTTASAATTRAAFGLYYSNGTPATNSFGSSGNYTDDTGYLVRKSINDVGNAANHDYDYLSCVDYGSGTANNPFSGAAGTPPLGVATPGAAVSGFNLADTIVHSGTLTLTYNSNGGIDITSSLTGSAGTFTPAKVTAPATGTNHASTFTFDEAMFYFDGSVETHLDNVQVIAVVPEPASVSLLGLGAVALLGRRRRA